MATEDNLLRGGRGDLQGGGAFGEPFAMRRRTVHAGAAATTAVGEVDPTEAIDADDLVGEAADGGVAGPGLMQVIRLAVPAHEGQDGVDELFLVRNLGEETRGEVEAFFFVTVGMPAVILLLLRRGRLPDIVQQHGKSDDEVLVAVAETLLGVSVKTLAGVIPHISLGMPFRILGHADHRVDFRIELGPATVLQESQAYRGLTSAEDELRPLFHQTLRWEVGLRERRAKRDCFRSD